MSPTVLYLYHLKLLYVFFFLWTRPFTFVCVYVQIPCITLTACASFAGACRSTSWQEMGARAFCSQRTVRDKNAWGKMSTSMTLCLVRCCMDTTTKRSKSTWDRYSKWPSGNLCPNSHDTNTRCCFFDTVFRLYWEVKKCNLNPIADIVTNFQILKKLSKEKFSLNSDLIEESLKASCLGCWSYCLCACTDVCVVFVFWGMESEKCMRENDGWVRIETYPLAVLLKPAASWRSGSLW